MQGALVSWHSAAHQAQGIQTSPPEHGEVGGLHETLMKLKSQLE